MPLTTVEPTRLYRQIANQIASLIDQGEFVAGARLPAERGGAHRIGDLVGGTQPPAGLGGVPSAAQGRAVLEQHVATQQGGVGAFENLYGIFEQVKRLRAAGGARVGAQGAGDQR